MTSIPEGGDVDVESPMRFLLVLLCNGVAVRLWLLLITERGRSAVLAERCTTLSRSRARLSVCSRGREVFGGSSFAVALEMNE